MTGSSNEDLKAKMREALERKQASDSGVEHTNHDRGHAEAHGPAIVRKILEPRPVKEELFNRPAHWALFNTEPWTSKRVATIVF